LLTPSPIVSIPLPSLLTPSPITSAAAAATRLLPTAGSPAATATTRPLDIGADSSATLGGTATGVPSLESLGLENEISMLPDGSSGYGAESWTSIEPELDAADSAVRGAAPSDDVSSGIFALVEVRVSSGAFTLVVDSTAPAGDASPGTGTSSEAFAFSALLDSCAGLGSSAGGGSAIGGCGASSVATTSPGELDETLDSWVAPLVVSTSTGASGRGSAPSPGEASPGFFEVES